VTVEVLVWNETVANLTLMALGSSAPEIMLAIIEQALLLGKEQGDSLGVFTIIGSAGSNMNSSQRLVVLLSKYSTT
jgi:solute carrier family 8 (sodium/calcium exchanger)